MSDIKRSKRKQNKTSHTSIKRKELLTKRTKEPSIILKVFIACLRVSLIAVLLIGIIGVGAVLGIGKAYVDTSPQLDLNKIKNQSETSFIFDKDGNLVAERSGVENRVWVSLDGIPLHLQNAVIAVEDAQFWSHRGINIRRIFGAAIANLRAGDPTGQGASTITQQLIKNTILDPEQTYKRKIQEAYLAIQLETRYSKDEILEAYLNTIWLGSSAYGVKTAANQYFDKELDELTIRESAMLAAIIRSPYFYRPFPDASELPEGAEPPYEPRHQSVVRTEMALNAMYDRGFINEAEYKEALADKILIAERPDPFRSDPMPYFIDYVIKELRDKIIQKYGWENDADRNSKAHNIINSGGLRIYTTLDQDMQKSVENSLETFERYPTNKNYTMGRTTGFPQPQASAVVLDYRTGEIRALVGARMGDVELRERLLFNNATDLRRDVGSTIKPIGVYGPALELGGTAADVYDDIPAPIGGIGYDHPRGYPLNYDGGFNGLTTAREAMRRSLNIPTAKILCEFVGIETSANILEKLGFDIGFGNHFEPVPAALAMGQGGASPLQMAAAFGSIPNEGIYIQPTTIVKVIDRDGNILLENKNPVRREVFKKTTSYILLDMLSDAVNAGTGGSARLRNMPVAGKTGTTSDFTDAWFTGFTPYYVAAVWVGNDMVLNDGVELGYVGGRRANGGNAGAPLWRHIMEPIHEELERKDFFERPDDIVTATVCTISGKLPTELCYQDPRNVVRTELFVRGTVPTEQCDYHVEVDICALSGLLPSEFCPLGQTIRRIFVRRPLDSPYHDLTPEEKAMVRDYEFELPFDPNAPENICTLHTAEWVAILEQLQQLVQHSKNLITNVTEKLTYYIANYRDLVTPEDESNISNAVNELQNAIYEYEQMWENISYSLNQPTEGSEDNGAPQPVMNLRSLIEEHRARIQEKYNNLYTISSTIFDRIEEEINNGNGENGDNGENGGNDESGGNGSNGGNDGNGGNSGNG